jgi:hypothetical protein
MKVNFDNFCEWEAEKATFLLLQAKKLGMRLDGHGELAVNSNSGYTYLWLEDYNFVLYMPISCELRKEDIYVMVTNFDDGEETEESLSEFGSLEGIENWANDVLRGVEV